MKFDRRNRCGSMLARGCIVIVDKPAPTDAAFACSAIEHLPEVITW